MTTYQAIFWSHSKLMNISILASSQVSAMAALTLMFPMYSRLIFKKVGSK